MKVRAPIAGLLLLGLASSPAMAGLLWYGKYSGAPVFDRWDACYLCNGPGLLYVSEKAKEPLRPYAGRPVQINVTKIYSIMNPGDARLDALTVVGPPPGPEDWEGPADKLKLTATMRVVKGKPEFRMKITNPSSAAVSVAPFAVGLAVLMKSEARRDAWGVVQDGPSLAVIHGICPAMAPSGSGMRDGVKYSWRFTSRPLEELPAIAPHQDLILTVAVDLPPGEYDFLFGYGMDFQRTCTASNLVAFDVDANRAAHAVLVPDR